MLHALARLVHHSWLNLMASLSMTDRAFIVLLCVLPLALYAARLVNRAIEARANGKRFNENLWEAIKKSWTETFILVGSWTVVWVALLGWSMARTVYEDYQGWMARDSSLRAQLISMRNERGSWKKQLVSAESAAKGKTKLVPAPKKQCWAFNTFGPPSPAVKGSVSATEVILYCNYKIDAPYEVAVRFDRDFIPGNVTPLGAPDGVIGGMGQKRGNVLSSVVEMPPLFAYTPLLVTVYSTAEQVVHSGRVSIGTIP